jgi:uncharacterized Zn finger protein
MSWYYNDWKPYVSVAERRRRAMKKMDALRKKGVDIRPVQIEGRKIAQTFWGEAWCHHLESFSDYENRLPRGRTYVRNGSVCHLAINQGQIEAHVSGSELYNVHITIKTLAAKKWSDVKSRCTGQIGSLIELLQGNLSDHVMQVVTDRQTGLFPLPGEIALRCSCPDSAKMCKHVAAVLYGVGSRLDHQPELLFKLRGVDHEELIAADAAAAVSAATSGGTTKRLAAGELSDVFGIDLDAASAERPSPTTRSEKTKRPRQKPAKKKVVKNRARATKAAARKATKAPKKKAKKTPKKAATKTPKKVAKKELP